MRIPGPPLIYFNDRGRGGGVRVIFLGLKFWPKGIFSVYERHRDFLGHEKSTKGFFGCAKEVGFFLGSQILKLEFFWV